MLGRYGLALLLTAAMAWILVRSTLPAIEQKERVRSALLEKEAHVQARRQESSRLESYAEAIQHDPLLRVRVAELERLSPAIPGPIVITPDQDDGEEAQPGGR